MLEHRFEDLVAREPLILHQHLYRDHEADVHSTVVQLFQQFWLLEQDLQNLLEHLEVVEVGPEAPFGGFLIFP